MRQIIILVLGVCIANMAFAEQADSDSIISSFHLISRHHELA
jgi:hypothetical protein